MRNKGACELYDVPNNVRREARLERPQLTFRARLFEANSQPFRRDKCTRGERMPTHDPRLAVLTREEANVVPDLGKRDVAYNLRDIRVESESGEYLAHACYGWLWNGKEGEWFRGKHIYAPRGWKYEGQLSDVCRRKGKKGRSGSMMKRACVKRARERLLAICLGTIGGVGEGGQIPLK